MLTMSMTEAPVAPNEDRDVFGPPTPDTVLVQNDQTTQQDMAVATQEDLDSFLRSEHGKRWCCNWKEGHIDDDMVVARWGRNVLELFGITRTIDEDPHALETQKAGESDEDKCMAVEVNKKDAKEAPETMPGYIAPVGDGEGEGRADVETAQDDIMEEHCQEAPGDDVVLMQRPVVQDFEQVLQSLLKAMDEMTGPKAARLSAFHPANPTLVDRFERLSALMAAVESDPPDLRGDETQWCLDAGQNVQPFLEDAALLGGDRPEDKPKPSQAVPRDRCGG